MAKYKITDPRTGETRDVELESADPVAIDSAYHALSNALSLPKQGVDWLARASAHAAGLPVADNATTGQMVRSGLGFNQGDEGMAGHLAGKALEIGTDAGMNPLTWGGLGLTGKAGEIANQGLLLQSGLGAAGAGKAALQGYAQQGMTPQVAEQGLDAASQALLFGAAARGHGGAAASPEEPTQAFGGVGSILGKSVDASEPTVAEGKTRLYRGEVDRSGPGTPTPTKNPGAWFTDDKGKAIEYASFAGKDGKLRYVDVPEAEVGNYLDKSGHYLLPQELSATKQELPFEPVKRKSTAQMMLEKQQEEQQLQGGIGLVPKQKWQGRSQVGQPPPQKTWAQMTAEAQAAQGIDKRGKPIVREDTDALLGLKPQTAEQANAVLRPAKERRAIQALQSPVMQTAVKKLAQNLGTSENPAFLNAGYFHDVYDLGKANNGQSYVMRVNNSEPVGQQNIPWPNSKHVVQPALRQQVGSKIFEILPKVDTSVKPTEAQLDALHSAVLKEGYSLVDPQGTGGNVAVINGKPTVVDPGALVPTPIEQEYQKYKSMQIPDGPAFDAIRAKKKAIIAQKMAYLGMGLGGGVLSAGTAPNEDTPVAPPPAPPELGVQ